MKTTFFLLLLLSCLTAISQKHFIKFNPITVFPLDGHISLHSYCGYEHRLSYRSSLELGASATLGTTFMLYDSGPFKLFSLNSKYRYYFHLKDNQIQKGIYVAAITRYQHKISTCGFWCMGTGYTNTLGAGGIFGKNFKTGENGFIDLSLGALFAFLDYQATLQQSDDGATFEPPTYYHIQRFIPQFNVSFHWGIALDKKPFSPISK